MAETLYPTGYGFKFVTLDELFRIHHVDKMHPEYARRLRAWIFDQRGNIGIGGSWRPDGTQPDKPGFAPEGKSFHQYQQFASGLIKFAAVDLVARNGSNVHRSPNWNEVPNQDSNWSKKCGLHANVNNEPWHLQAIEIDGYDRWVNKGRPDPVPNYPISDIGELEMKIVNPPQRIYDSRTTGKLNAGQTVSVKAPAAAAVFVNVTVTEAADKGHVIAWDGLVGRPQVSNLNYNSGDTICNTSWVPVSPNGTFTVYTKSACHIIVDLQATA